MIKVTKQKNNVIYYECENCNTHGMCTVKPTENDIALVVIELECPVCSEMERVTIMQYSSEDNKKYLLDNLDDFDLSWTLTKNEEIL